MTGTPALISKCERLAAFGKHTTGSHRQPSQEPLPDTIGQTLQSDLA